MTIPALWFNIGIGMAVEAEKAVAVAAHTGIETLLESASIRGYVNPVALPD